MSRYVNIDKVLKELRLNHKDVIYIDKNDTAKRIEKIPSIDIVRCGECKHRKKNGFCLEHNRYEKNDNGYCSYGEREGE